MSLIKSPAEIELLAQGGKILHSILQQVAAEAKPGVSTAELNALAERLIAQAGGRPSFKNYGQPPYPAALCTSVNSQVVHGIPKSEVILKNGDIISLDIGMEYPAVNGLYTDMAITVPVGKISEQAKKLIRVTRQALDLVKQHLKPGLDLNYLGGLIQKHVEKNGFSIVRALVGHGVGHAVHEEPQVPNYVVPGFEFIVKPGMVLAFEPMVAAGHYDVVTEKDHWTVRTKDNSLAAHFEHTFAVTADGCEIVT